MSPFIYFRIFFAVLAYGILAVNPYSDECKSDESNNKQKMPARHGKSAKISKEMPYKKQPKILAQEERRNSRGKASGKTQQQLNDPSDVGSDSSANSSPATKFLKKRLKHRSDSFLGSILFKRGIDQFSSSPRSDKSDRFSYSSPSNNISDHRSDEANNNASENDSSILSEQTENEITPADFDYGQSSNSSEHFSYGSDEMPYGKATTVPHDQRIQSNTVELSRTSSDNAVPKFGKVSKLSNLGEKLHLWHLEKTLDMRLWKLKMKDASIVRHFSGKKNNQAFPSNSSSGSNISDQK